LLVRKKPRLLKSDFCVAVDGGLEWVSSACSGVVYVKMVLKGKGGHAGYDFESDDLFHRTIGFLNELKEYKKIRESKKSFISAPKNPKSKKMFGRFNITSIHAGSQSNILPSEVKVLCDLRLLPEENGNTVASEFRKFAFAKAKKYSLKPRVELSVSDGYYAKKNKFTSVVSASADKVTGKKLRMVSEFGGTDARYIDLLKIPAYTFGPGGKGIHSDKERITLGELKKTKEFVKNLLA